MNKTTRYIPKTKELIEQSMEEATNHAGYLASTVVSLCDALVSSEKRVVELERSFDLDDIVKKWAEWTEGDKAICIAHAILETVQPFDDAAPPASPGEEDPICHCGEPFRAHTQASNHTAVEAENPASPECDTCLGTGAVGEYPCPVCWEEEP